MARRRENRELSLIASDDSSKRLQALFDAAFLHFVRFAG